MLGPDLLYSAQDVVYKQAFDTELVSTSRGVILRAGQHLLSGLGRGKLSMSYLQIYNERVHDLLMPHSFAEALQLREEPSGEVTVPQLTVEPVASEAQLARYLIDGSEHRSYRATTFNEASSRSHAVVTFYVETRDGERTRRSRLDLVDLAGSERWEPGENSVMSKAHATELMSINKSLSALGHCIHALAKRSAHVPYR